MSTHERRRKVVMVDDDDDYRAMLRDWLMERYDTVALPNGESLIEQLFIALPDLVVLDVSMPGPDGFTLCERIRSEPRFQDLPVLFLTSSERNSDFAANLSAGGSAYMTKPVQRGQLLSRIAELLPSD